MKINKELYEKMPQDIQQMFSQMHDESCPEAEFAKYGEKKSTGKTYDYTGQKEYQVKGFIENNKPNSPSNRGDGGTPSRFFYAAKTSTKERNAGCEHLEAKQWSGDGAAVPERANRPFKPSYNNHPTVKPSALMRYLIKLITPKGGLVLDPFTGSGSTGKSAILDGYCFIGIELDAEYCKIAQARCEHSVKEIDALQ